MEGSSPLWGVKGGQEGLFLSSVLKFFSKYYILCLRETPSGISSISQSSYLPPHKWCPSFHTIGHYPPCDHLRLFIRAGPDMHGPPSLLSNIELSYIHV